MSELPERVSLKEYLEAKIEGVEQATKLAKESMEKRLESMNEFRDTLRDQAAKFIIRTEFELVVSRLEQDIKNLEAARATMLSIVTYEVAHKDLQKQVDDLRLSKALLEGKASQQSVNVALIISVLGLLIGGIGLITKFIPQ